MVVTLISMSCAGSSLLGYTFPGVPHTFEFVNTEARHAQQLITDKGLIADSVDVSNRQIKEAIKVWQKHVKAVRAGDWKRASQCWNKEEVEKFKNFDWQLNRFTKENEIELYRNYEPVVMNAVDRKEYVELEIEWRSNSKPIRKETRYFIQEDGKIVGANPIRIFTKDWLTKETEYFVLYYKPGENPREIDLKKLDEFYESLTRLLGISSEKKIEYYKCQSCDEVGKIFGLRPTAGRAFPEYNFVACVSYSSYHEITHVLAYEINSAGASPPPILEEGLAVWFGGTTFLTKEYCSQWAKTFMREEPQAAWLDSLVENFDFFGTNTNRDYVLAGSFVGFLIDTYGIEDFKNLYVSTDRFNRKRKGFKDILKEIYGQSINRLEEQWKQYVLGLSIPEIKPGMNPRAEVIFSMSDPVGDDYGDGNYTYPQDPDIKPGIADLTHFTVSEDADRVYFELTFKNLVNPDSSSVWGFGKTYVTIIIDAGPKVRGGLSKFSLYGSGLTLCSEGEVDFEIHISCVGIEVWDYQTARLGDLKRRGKVKDYMGNVEKKCIAFSIPKQIIGEPVPEWKYGVAVGFRQGGNDRLGGTVGRFCKVGEFATENQGGGGPGTDFSPNVYDILTSEGIDQRVILGSCSAKRRAILPLISAR